MCVHVYMCACGVCVCLGVCKTEVDIRMSSSVALYLFLFLSYLLLCVCKYDVGDTHGTAREWRSKGNGMELILSSLFMSSGDGTQVTRLTQPLNFF